MKSIFTILSRMIALLVIIAIFGACEETTTDPGDENEEQTGFVTGNNTDQDEQKASSVPGDLSLVTLADADVNLPGAVMLYDYIPPIGNQGQIGTCTAWGTGYYARTIMHARENNLSKTDLNNNANVFSPKYLFLATEGHGTDCNGSSIYHALKAMQNKGIASIGQVPYSEDMDCSGGAPSVSEAAKYKIENYRDVDPLKVESIKMYLKMGRPVIAACDVATGFSFIEDEVVYDQDYSGKYGGHAMCVVGYDDAMGTGGAFRIVNSWGSNWGDAGYCWVDYDFFVNRFCKVAYVIEGDKGGLADNMVDDKVINPNYQVSGKDLLTIELMDEEDPDGGSARERIVTYNVFNRGNQTVNASNDWNIVYYYYNANNPESDYGIILYDYYTDDVGAEYKGKNNDFDSVSVDMKKYGTFNWWNYVDVPAGWSVAKAVYSTDGYDYDFGFYYTVPNITGKYYFVMLADGFNDFDEQYEQNNYIFFTGSDRGPLDIKNGVIQNASAYKPSANAGELKKDQPNAYSIEEISALIDYQKRTGILDKAAKEKRMDKTNGFVVKGKRPVKAVLNRSM